MGLAVLAGGLAFVGSAEATELITDGSFENTTTAPSSPIVKVGGTPAPGGWRLEHFQHISLLHALYASRAGRVRSAISAHWLLKGMKGRQTCFEIGMYHHI